MASYLSSETKDSEVTGFICKDNLPISTADYAVKLLKAMFSVSKIPQKYSDILSKAAAKKSVSNLKLMLSTSDLVYVVWFCSSEEYDNVLLIFIRHFESNGVIIPSLLNMIFGDNVS